MSVDAAEAVETARALRRLHESEGAVLEAVSAIEAAGPERAHQRAFELAMTHGDLRAVGFLATWPADERVSLLRAVLPDEAVRTFALSLLDRVRTPPTWRALSSAMPGSFRPPDAAAWDAYRARLRARPDEKIWGDPDAVGVRHLWVTPASEHHTAIRSVSRAPFATHEPARPVATRAVDDVLSEAEAMLVASTGSRTVFVVGAAGLGKSTFAEMLSDRLAARSDVTPVLVRLRDLSPDRPLLEEVERALVAEGFAAGVDLRMVPRLVLLLDGFDELGEGARPVSDVFFLRVRDLVREGLVHGALLTGRDALLDGHDGCFPEGAEVFELEPFDRARVEQWADNWERVTGHRFDTSRFTRGEGAEAEDSLRDVASHPLMLYMLARMEASGETVSADTFEDRARVYRKIISWCCARHEALRPHDRWKAGHMRRFLRAAGYAAMVRRREVLRLDDVRESIRALGLETSDDPARFAAERTILAFTPRGATSQTWEFTHRSFGEFLAAEQLASVALRVVERARSTLDDDETWRLDVGEATREWLGAFGPMLVTSNVERYFVWLLREAGDEVLKTLRARLGDLYRELVEETEAEEAVRVGRAWAELPSRVRGYALANAFMLGGVVERFRPEEAHPGRFIDAVHAIRLATFATGDLRRVYECVGLQGIKNESVRDTQAWRGIFLSGIDAERCDLSEIDVSLGLLRGTFSGARFGRAQLSFSTIVMSQFVDADMRGADFIGAKVSESNFTGADLSAARVQNADFNKCDFTDAILPEDFEQRAHVQPPLARPLPVKRSRAKSR